MVNDDVVEPPDGDGGESDESKLEPPELPHLAEDDVIEQKLRRDVDRAARRARRRRRKRLCDPHPGARPAVFFERSLRGDSARTEIDLRLDSHRWPRIEKLLRAVQVVVLALVALLFLAELASQPSGWALTAVGWISTVVGSVGVVVILLDLMTYEPRLFSNFSNPSDSQDLFRWLAHAGADDQFQNAIDDLDATNQPATPQERDAPKLARRLLKEVYRALSPAQLRHAVFLRVARTLVSLAFSLALLGYGLGVLAGGMLTSTLTCAGATACGISDYAFLTFSILTTQGVGELVAGSTWAGGLFFAAHVAVLVLVGYFVIGFLVSTFGKFEENVRLAAHAFVRGEP